VRTRRSGGPGRGHMARSQDGGCGRSMHPGEYNHFLSKSRNWWRLEGGIFGGFGA
jgi:hypothetical protein